MDDTIDLESDELVEMCGPAGFHSRWASVRPKHKAVGYYKRIRPKTLEGLAAAIYCWELNKGKLQFVDQFDQLTDLEKIILGVE